MKKFTAMLMILLLAGAASLNAQERVRNAAADSTRMRGIRMGRPISPMRDSLRMRRMPGTHRDSMMIRMPVMRHDSTMMRGMHHQGMIGHGMYPGGFDMRHQFMPGYGWGWMGRRMSPWYRFGYDMPRSHSRMGILENIPNLTDKQKTAIEDLRAQQQTEMKKLRDEMSEKMNALRKSHREKIMNLLTDEQKKWVEDQMNQ